jgi:hypothetical protein
MIIEYLYENVNLTGLTRKLNESDDFGKQSGKPFTTNDVNQYIQLGHLPHYMGGNKIDESDIRAKGIKLYNLRK